MNNTWILLLLIVLLVPCIIAWCKVFRKTGLHPGKLFIPVYGQYLQYLIADSEGLFGASLILLVVYSLVAVSAGYQYIVSSPALLAVSGVFGTAFLVLHIIFCIRLARVFGKNGGFAVGLIFLFPVFLCILGFGGAKYIYHTGSASQETWTCPTCRTVNPAHDGLCVRCRTMKPIA